MDAEKQSELFEKAYAAFRKMRDRKRDEDMATETQTKEYDERYKGYEIQKTNKGYYPLRVSGPNNFTALVDTVLDARGVVDIDIERRTKLDVDYASTMGTTPPTAEPIEQSARGGQSAELDVDYTEVPQLALTAVAKRMKKALDKYSSCNWHNCTVTMEINHALAHLFNALSDLQMLDKYGLLKPQDAEYDVDHKLISCQTGSDDEKRMTQIREELAGACCRVMMAYDNFVMDPLYISDKEKKA